jgi:hypothetical protein
MNYEEEPLVKGAYFYANKYNIKVIPDKYVREVFSATDQKLINEENNRRRKESQFWFEVLDSPDGELILLLVFTIMLISLGFYFVFLDVQKGNWLSLVFFTLMVIFWLWYYFDVKRRYTRVKSMSHLKDAKYLSFNELTLSYDCQHLGADILSFLRDIEEQKCGKILVKSFGRYTFLAVQIDITEYYLAEMREKLPNQNVIFYQGSQ